MLRPCFYPDYEMNSHTLENNQLSPIRCSSCGRFLGYALLLNGVILLLCKNCKAWTVAAEGEVARLLTTEEIYAMVSRR